MNYYGNNIYKYKCLWSLDLLMALKIINIFTFCFILQIGKNHPVYYTKQNFIPSKDIVNTKSSSPTAMTIGNTKLEANVYCF